MISPNEIKAVVMYADKCGVVLTLKQNGLLIEYEQRKYELPYDYIIQARDRTRYVTNIINNVTRFWIHPNDRSVCSL